MTWVLAVLANFLASTIVFWLVVAVLILSEVGSLADRGRDESLGWVWTCSTVTVILFYLRYRPSFVTVGYIFGIWALTGIVYSVFRWAWQCKKIRKNIESEFNKIKTWPAGANDKISLQYSEILNDTTYTKASWEKSDALNYFRPVFNNRRGRVTMWATLWPIFVIRDLTIDLIRNLQDLLSGVYQAISNKMFEV
jgi:hypothetical protein